MAVRSVGCRDGGTVGHDMVVGYNNGGYDEGYVTMDCDICCLAVRLVNC